jgi:malate dehydrogenase (oxaloacetate-decarboxylating)(NADP+)
MLDKPRITDEDALYFHKSGRPGKLEITATKPMTTQRDLSLAYSPGVAVPCLEIHKNPVLAYDYTAKGNVVAVISNGTAVLGLGNLGALASKPVMEGKAVLFKKFADVDGIDLEIATEDIEEFINAVKYLGPSFGGINLEDIKAPDCFIIEERLKACMDIPVFHDDQHGTAIIAAAGMINALDITDRKMSDVKIVVNGAGAAAIACIELLKAMGLRDENLTLCDSKGVVYKARKEGMNEWKAKHATDTKARTLEEAMVGADAFLGVSVKDAVTKEMVKSMADHPIIFALANPDPEILPELVKEVRDDAIMATGRSDYPNQVNNVLGFPYIFRGALDVRAKTINDEMKIAAAKAIAKLARKEVTDEVSTVYAGQSLAYGKDYIIPVPFDQRLMVEIPTAVAEAAIKSNVAQLEIKDMKAYRNSLKSRLDPTSSVLNLIFEKLRANNRKIIFVEGEQERAIRAAYVYEQEGFGRAILIGQEDEIQRKIEELGLDPTLIPEIQNAKVSKHNEAFIEKLYKKHQRSGLLYKDCQRLVHHDRYSFAALMVDAGLADGMLAGLTRGFKKCHEKISKVIDTKEGHVNFGLSIAMAKKRTLFIADTSVHEHPDAETLANIAIQSARKAQQLGHKPRVALISHSSFGQGKDSQSNTMQKAIEILESKNVDFEFDGEMTIDIALDETLRAKFYPFCKLTGNANILIMPSLNAANIASRLIHKMDNTVIGPLLNGPAKPVQIAQSGATVSEIMTMAALAAYDSICENN